MLSELKFIANSSRNYHLIIEGTNELTSKISCTPNTGLTTNLTKYYSVNVTGSREPSLTIPARSSSSGDKDGNGTYIEITAEYSSNKHGNSDNNNPKIEIRSSSGMTSMYGKLKTGENMSDLSKYIHNIIKERIDKIRD